MSEIKSKRNIIFLFLISILLISNILLLIAAFQLFPTYGGHTRQILFIKPNEQTDESGYFIILDELTPKAQEYDIDLLLHSRGDLKIAEDRQSVAFSVPSYLSNDNITLNATFLEHTNDINSAEGIFCPKNYDEGNNYPDIDTTYIKARYSGSANPIMSTVLYPKNESDNTQIIPNTVSRSDGLKQIGSHDFLFHQENRILAQFTNPNIEFNGELFFIRTNKSDSTKIDYLYLQQAKVLKFGNNQTFQSTNSISSLLLTYSNSTQISGYINGRNTQISIYCPFGADAVEMVKLNGLNTTFSVSPSEDTISFTILES
ncbi:MAG: hypothetical protein EU541_06300, partial [Promethearchaeota archaeon]